MSDKIDGAEVVEQIPLVGGEILVVAEGGEGVEAFIGGTVRVLADAKTGAMQVSAPPNLLVSTGIITAAILILAGIPVSEDLDIRIEKRPVNTLAAIGMLETARMILIEDMKSKARAMALAPRPPAILPANAGALKDLDRIRGGAAPK